ncbi:MAG: hypothetical protein RLZZ546_602 [Bacteroidota bacterium]
MISLVLLHGLNSFCIDYYTIIKKVTKIEEGKDCFIISYSIYSDNNTATNPNDDDVLVLNGNALVGKGCGSDLDSPLVESEVLDIQKNDENFEKLDINLSYTDGMISLRSSSLIENVRLDIYNEIGHLVKKSAEVQLQDMQTNDFDIGALNTGEYFVVVYNGKKIIKTLNFAVINK